MTSAPRDAPTNARPSSRTNAANDFLSGNDHRLVDAVLFGDQDLDALCIGGGHVLAHVVGPYRQLTVAAVDEHDVLDTAVALHDLVGDARQRSPDLVRVHHRRLQATLRDAHAVTGPAGTTRDSVSGRSRCEEPTSTAANAYLPGSSRRGCAGATRSADLLGSPCRRHGGSGLHGRRRSVGLDGAVTLAACRGGPCGRAGRCEPGGSRPIAGPRPRREISRRPEAAGA